MCGSDVIEHKEQAGNGKGVETVPSSTVSPKKPQIAKLQAATNVTFILSG